jgi:hypothetical protein
MRTVLNKLLLTCPLAAVLLFTGCSKENDAEVTGISRVSFTHAADEPALLDAYVDNEKITTTALSPGNTSGNSANPYFSVNAGLRSLRISPDGVANVLQGNFPFKPEGVYSIFAYDTINLSGTLRALVLTDNLTAPADAKANIRFIQLSPDTGRISIELSNSIDTVRFNARAYVGTLGSSEGLATFSSVNPGNYTLYVRTTGSNTVLYSTPLPLSFAVGKIYTIYCRGRKANGYGTTTGFNISYFSHN